MIVSEFRIIIFLSSDWRKSCWNETKNVHKFQQAMTGKTLLCAIGEEQSSAILARSFPPPFDSLFVGRR